MTRICPHISVCICTYKRPELLSRLLHELENQETEGQFKFSITVVDNDSRQSGKNAVDSIKLRSPINIQYFVEPEQNIALARNKAVDNAEGDFIAFIDDDEFPVNMWLLSHFNFLKSSMTHGSLGPVLPHYEKTPPKWLLQGRFFNRPSYKTGKVLHWNETRSGNVFLNRSIICSFEPAFNPIFGSGGEDKDFFRRYISKGCIFSWCAEAPVYERIPEARCKRSYLIRRALLRGKAKARAVPQDVMSVVKSLLGIFIYTLALPVTLFLGHYIFMQTLIKGCDHLGNIITLCGFDIIKEKYIQT